MNEEAVILVLKILDDVFGAIAHKNASYFLCTQVNINLGDAASGLIKQMKINIKPTVVHWNAKPVINT
jgi:hypothetical protein